MSDDREVRFIALDRLGFGKRSEWPTIPSVPKNGTKDIAFPLHHLQCLCKFLFHHEKPFVSYPWVLLLTPLHWISYSENKSFTTRKAGRDSIGYPLRINLRVYVLRG